jgi:hypothetical protein
LNFLDNKNGVLHQRPVFVYSLRKYPVFYRFTQNSIPPIPAVTTATAMAIHPPVIKAPASGRGGQREKNSLKSNPLIKES